MGTTLVELMVALPIAAVIGAIAVSLLVNNHKLHRRVSAQTEITRELRQAAAVLASEIRPLSASDLIAWTDTSIELQSLAGSGIVCARPSNTTVDMLPLGGSDALRTAWFSTPQAGDDVYATAADSSVWPQDAPWRSARLTTTASAPTSQCTTEPLMTRGNAAAFSPVRLTLSSHLSPAIGSLLRITRRTRYSLYKASDGLWYLGRKTHNGATWTVIQPAAGPFDKPLLHGLHLVVRDSVGNELTSATRTPRSVTLMLRASSAWLRAPARAGVVDSVIIEIALRSQLQRAVP